MHRLEKQDDARLRFLLGYLEYYGGDQVTGMRNIERAAELDRGQSIISRFPDMLRKEGLLPPPTVPGQKSVVPETEESPPGRENQEGP